MPSGGTASMEGYCPGWGGALLPSQDPASVAPAASPWSIVLNEQSYVERQAAVPLTRSSTAGLDHSRPLRVLTFGRYADENFGGLERYVFELAHALKREAHFANIVARRGPPPDTINGSETVYAKPIAHLGGTPICPSMPLHALRLHHARSFDIVHLQF